MIVRKAASNDVDAIARIWYTGWLDAHLGNVPPELIRYRSRESFTPRSQDRIPTTWVAELDGQVVGFVVVADDELEQIYVDAAARGTGVAGKLLRQAETEIRSAGHRKAWLAVVARNRELVRSTPGLDGEMWGRSITWRRPRTGRSRCRVTATRSSFPMLRQLIQQVTRSS